jgi:hypothetical protein
MIPDPILFCYSVPARGRELRAPGIDFPLMGRQFHCSLPEWGEARFVFINPQKYSIWDASSKHVTNIVAVSLSDYLLVHKSPLIVLRLLATHHWDSSRQLSAPDRTLKYVYILWQIWQYFGYGRCYPTDKTSITRQRLGKQCLKAGILKSIA